eukprot:5333752-Ditylum_brightwellii.AAC.1
MKAYQVFNNFEEFTFIHKDMTEKVIKGIEIDMSKDGNSFDVPKTNDKDMNLHIVHIASVMPVLFENNLTIAGLKSSKDIEAMYEFSVLMGFWTKVIGFNYHADKGAAEYVPKVKKERPSTKDGKDVRLEGT